MCAKLGVRDFNECLVIKYLKPNFTNYWLSFYDIYKNNLENEKVVKKES
jgi:hypothetical protein